MSMDFLLDLIWAIKLLSPSFFEVLYDPTILLNMSLDINFAMPIVYCLTDL